MKKVYNPHFTHNRTTVFDSVTDDQWSDYHWQLAHRITDLETLSSFFVNANFDFSSLAPVVARFPFAVTPYFLALMDHSDLLHDPLAKQVVPDLDELSFDPRLTLDPFKEKSDDRSPVPGLVRRYPDRVIVVTTSVCPALCRYCTRKWNWDTRFHLTRNDVVQIVAYLKQHKEIREVILSGGEPFLLDPSFLEYILDAVSSVDSVETIRIGTRILSFLPYRIDEEIERILAKYAPIWIVTHFDHPHEISKDTEAAVTKLIRAGTALCNQSVLLKGINDTPEVMTELVHALQRILIKPYYLFYPDLIEGTTHFRGNIEDGLAVMSALRGRTGGICVPYFVVDLPDGGKIPLLPEYIIDKNEDAIVFKNYEQKSFIYKK